MRAWRWVAGLGLAAGLLGCGPAPSGADAGACRDAAKSPPNLLENPGFECGDSGWSAIYGTLAAVAGGHAGQALQLTTSAAGGRFAYAKDVVTEGGLKTYCFTAWVKGTAPFMRLRVLRDFGGQVQEDQFNEALGPEWKRTPPVTPLKVPNGNAPKIQLVFEVQTSRPDGQNAKPGDTLLVDDVDVWETSGSCTEAR